MSRELVYQFPDGPPVYLLPRYDDGRRVDVLGPPYRIAVDFGGYGTQRDRKATLHEIIAGLEQELVRLTTARKDDREASARVAAQMVRTAGRNREEDLVEMRRVDALNRRLVERLVAVEWAGWNGEGYDPAGGYCPECSTGDRCNAQGQHQDDCALDAALVAANLDTQTKLNELRALIAERAKAQSPERASAV